MAERKVERFEDLFVWQKAHQLVLHVYKATKKFPKDELYGLFHKSDGRLFLCLLILLRDFRKRTKAEKQRFLTIAHGSLEETRYFLILSKDLGYCDTAEMRSLAEEVSKLLTLYYRKIEDFR